MEDNKLDQQTTENQTSAQYLMLAFFEQHKVGLVKYYPVILEANHTNYDDELVNEIIAFMKSELSGVLPNMFKKWNSVRFSFLQYQLSGTQETKLNFLKQFRIACYVITNNAHANYNEKLMFALHMLNTLTENNDFDQLISHFDAEWKINKQRVTKTAMVFVLAMLQQMAKPELVDMFYTAAANMKLDI